MTFHFPLLKGAQSMKAVHTLALALLVTAVPQTSLAQAPDGGALEAHFGLGAATATAADVTVTLLDGRTKTFLKLAADVSHSLKMEQSQ
jgi:hypothetical protein